MNFRTWHIVLIGVLNGLFVGVLAASVYHAATGKPVLLEWVEPTMATLGLFLLIGINLGQVVLFYAVFRWFTRYIGMSRGPTVTRQIGGHDVRKSRRGTELPPLRITLRRLWCKHYTISRVKTHEGVERLCASCGKDMETGPATEWV